jgi:hypothetical protein
MKAFRVSIVASDETLLWTTSVEARDGHDAKQQAIAIMQLAEESEGNSGIHRLARSW